MNPKILYIAPLKDFSGYATAARDYVRALDSVGANLVTRSLTYDGGNHRFSPREKELLNRDLQNVDIVLQHTTPNEMHVGMPNVFNVGYFAWETDRVPDEWVQQVNKLDLAFMPCDENIKAAKRSGVIIPIEKIVHTFDAAKYKKLPPFDLPGSEHKFKFLAICQVTKKKGVDALIKAFCAEFRSREDVMLVLKVYFGSNDTDEHKEKMIGQVAKIRELLRINDYAPIHIVHSVLDEDAVGRLYCSSDAYVLPSRGEGWSIPHFDAMGYGLPPIALAWGGPSEFITPECGWLTSYTMGPCFDMPHPHSFMYTGRDNWAEPDLNALRSAMREAYNEWRLSKAAGSSSSKWNNRVEACKARVLDFSYDKVGKLMHDRILHHYNLWRQNEG
jgi:glycosyltransferase involved in cell wall biosynthesis